MGRPPERPRVEIELDEDPSPPGRSAARADRRTDGAGPGARGWFRRSSGPTARRSPLRSSRTLVGLAAGALAVVVGVGLVVARQDRAPVAAVAGATSADLSVPLREMWRVETRGAFSITAGLLLVTERTGEGLQVTAHGLRQGETRWSHPVDWADATTVRCPNELRGPDGAVIVCQVLGGLVPTANPSVVAQDPGWLVLLDAESGAVVDERRLRGTHLSYATHDGDLVTVDRADGVVEIVRTEGVSTRQVWTTDLEVEQSPRRTAVQVQAREGLLVVLGSAAAVLDAESGRVLNEWVPTSTNFRAARAQVTVVSHGVAVRPAGTEAAEPTLWYSLTGEQLAQVPGVVDEPALGDGSVPDVVLAVQGDMLTAVDVQTLRARDLGPTDTEEPVLRRDGQVVLDGAGWVRGVDLVTGEERWRSRAEGLDQVSKVTDGRHVLVSGSSPQEGQTLSSVSLSDGSLAWKTALPPGGRALTWAGDTVLMVGTRAVIGLG